MAVIRGTTPTFKLTINDNSVDLTEALNIYATFKQFNTIITKTDVDLEVSAHEVDVYLSQSETLQFTEGTVEIQLNWTYADGTRAATKIATINLTKNLIGSVIE